MSGFFIVQWFDDPNARPAVNTEMRDYEKPIAQTKSWLADQTGPAGAIVIAYSQGPKVFDLTPQSSYVFVNPAGKRVPGFEQSLQARITGILGKQGLALPTRVRAPKKATTKKPAKKKPAKKPTKRRPDQKASKRPSPRTQHRRPPTPGLVKP